MFNITLEKELKHFIAAQINAGEQLDTPHRFPWGDQALYVCSKQEAIHTMSTVTVDGQEYGVGVLLQDLEDGVGAD